MKFLERGIYTLLNTEPYFAHFILNSRILYDAHNVATAGVAVVNGITTLVFNTKFMNSLSDKEAVGVLKHEILHLVLVHIGRQASKDKHLYNLAADVAINQHITSIPEGGITIAKLNEMLNTTLDTFQTAEYYYDFIKQKADKMDKARTTDDHDLEIQGADANAEQIKAAISKTSATALDAAKGNVSSQLSKVISNLNSAPKVNWKQILRNFVSTSTSSKTLNTRNKANRRFDLDFPGKKKKRELVLGVCVDSSGSVSDTAYEMFLNEISHISAHCSKVYLVHADCEVQRVDVIKSKKDVKFDRVGNGGTAYAPAITECVKRKCNAIVYFGDMDTSDTPSNPGVPVLWVTVGSDVKPGSFGHMVRLE